jgi:tetratricopeptide (TPR) repeat protein
MLQDGVFINYRGEDSYSYGALLHAELSHRFGPNQVFLDSESIPAGADYVEQLLRRVRQARVVLAVIGSRWLTAAGPGGRRIDDPDDWIRRELMEAFAAGLRVIPVLTDDADMPTAADLPDELALLARCQFRRLRHRDASVDLARLVTELADLDPELAAAAAKSAEPPGWQPPARAGIAARVLSGGQPPDQIPAVPGYFTGRAEELTRLVRDRSAGPMVSAVNGMPGVGKTALAVRAARHLTDAGRYPDGVLFLDLRGFSNKAQMSPATALDGLLHSLGVPGVGIPADIQARTALYRTVVARRRLLIVLDNARDEAQVRPLLPGTGDSLVLVTSRRRLAGLDDAEHLSVDVLSVPEAVRLFRAMVDTHDRDMDRMVEEIVRLCGLLPLAIRIAGARLRTTRALSTERLLAQLRTEQGRLNVLDDGERSVKAALAVSYRHLPVAQQRALAVLGLHPGQDFEPCATAALLNTSPQHALRLLDALEQVSLADQQAVDRYSLHDLVRTYALTLDAGTKTERRTTLGRLYDYYARGACRAMDLIYPYEIAYRPHPSRKTGNGQVGDTASRSPGDPVLPDATAATRWLDAEMSNLLAAAHHAASHGRPDHTIHQSATVHRHLRTVGKYGHARALHQHALDLARATRNTASELDALIALGVVFRTAGGPAVEHLHDAIDKARNIGSATGEMRAVTVLGQVLFTRGEHSHAADAFHRALNLAQSSKDQLGKVEALAGLGRVHYLQGRLDPSAECFEQALATAQQLHYPLGQVDALIGLAYVTCAQGRYAAAITRFEQSWALAHGSGHLAGELNALVGMGNVNRMQQHYDTAANYYNRVLEISRAIGDRNGELGALSGLANSKRLQGHHKLAKQHFEQMLHLSRALGGRNYQLDAYLGLGRTHHALGNPEQALDANLQALKLAEELGQQPDQVRALDGVAHARRTLGQPQQAKRLWQQALQILNNLGTTTTEDVTAHEIQTALDTT